MQYKIQQLRLGGILDQAISLTKNHFGLLFGIMLLLTIPLQLIQGFVQLANAPEFPPGATAAEIFAAQMEQGSSLGTTFPLSLLGMFVVFPVTNAAVIHGVARLYLGHETSAVDSIKRGFSSLLPLIWTSILYTLAVMGGFILLIIPGILFALWFGLYQHVVVIERTRGLAALKRSKQLVRPYLGTFLLMGLVMIVISVALNIGAAFVPQPHVQLIVVIFLNAVTTILGTAALVVFYFSCRCGVENFDLHYLAESIGVQEPMRETSELEES